jgi:adenine-specific DNA glycosylase
MLGGLWRFPGAEGKGPRALRSALKKDPGLAVTVGKEIFAVDHVYSHFAVTVHVFDCRLRAYAPRAGPLPGRWVTPVGAARLALSKLERMILQRLKSPQGRAVALPRGKSGANRVTVRGTQKEQGGP